MPLAPPELRRGRIVYALSPFVAEFPLRVADGSTAATVEDFARRWRGRATRVISEGRLRPVLLVHDGTRGEHEDVICLRVNTVKAAHRRHATTWKRIERQQHPFFFHLRKDARHGLPQESVIALASIGAIHKSAILGRRHVGELSVEEMRTISERLAMQLSLDLAPLIAAKARELLRRAGVVK